MPQVIFEFNAGAGNHTIAAGPTGMNLTRQGDFPAAPYQITGADIYFSRVLVEAAGRKLEAYSNDPGVEGTLLITQPMYQYGYATGQYYNDVVFGLSAAINYPALTRLYLRSQQGETAQPGAVINIRAGSVVRVRVNYELTTTACTPPAALSLSAGLSEGAVTLSGSGAGGGVGNGITGYEVEYADSPDGYSFTGFSGYTICQTGAGSFSLSVLPPDTRGHYRKFRARTLGTAGSGYASGFTESPAVRRNAAPYAPDYVSVSPAILESGSVSVWWPAAYDADGNAAYYTVQRRIAGGEWVTCLTTGALNMADMPMLSRGDTVKYRVLTVDSFGVASGFMESGEIRRNRSPDTPSIICPNEGAVTLSTRPAIKAALGTEPDGQSQTLQMSVDGGAFLNIGTLHTLALAAGAHSLRVRSVDSFGALSAEMSRGFTVEALLWQRGISAGQFIAGATVSHRADISELLGKINTVRGYYGLAPIGLPGSIGAWAAWQGQMQSLQAALGECFMAAGKAAPAFAGVPAYPAAAVVNQLRTQLGVA